MVTTLGTLIDDSACTSLPEKLRNCTEALLDSATRLREALIHHRTTDIWELLARQEEQMSLLEQYRRTWVDTRPSSAALESTETTALRQRIRESLQRVRDVHRSNFALAKGLLSAVRRAMASVDGGMGTTGSVYTDQGRPRCRNTSVIVNRIG
ncbi:MAG: hypothetical protein A3K19_19560 [Lentisphaerae bacterium RIFOXYB12_FULL_65_16]|nr:MAG: hypothetical protein A3K18_31255 [Lentisphaerae bacterium RIFOXYA12_64_32]OGV92060.1 MAG: hypothetical protein A3K19_19560 [Lentisphaerae bacterium RIFOXYB12_FULL_65_16]